MAGEKTYLLNLSLLGDAEVSFPPEGDSLRASGRLPQDLELFRDHFPGFPVLPGVLGLEILKRCVDRFYDAADKKEGSFSFSEVSMAKFSSFLRPGDTWEPAAGVFRQEESETLWKGTLVHAGRVAVSAQLKYRTAV